MMKKPVVVLSVLAMLLGFAVFVSPAARADGDPVITATDVPAGDQMQLEGTGFGASETVDIVLMDLAPVTLGVLFSDPSGEATDVLVVPVTVTAGLHVLTATGESSGLSATTTVTITSRYHVLAFNANGGKPALVKKAMKAGVKLGALPKASRAGYLFKGWFSAKSGGSKLTSASKMGSSDKTVYAHWAAKKYKVSFNANGGKAAKPKSKTVTMGKSYGKLASTSRSNYSFLGWFTAKSGGTKVTSATKFTKAASQTLYAHWASKYVTIPDAHLRVCFHQAMNLPNSAKIPLTRAQKLRGLTCDGWKITSLKGLSSLKSLTYLELNNTGISDISLIASLTKLTSLYLVSLEGFGPDNHISNLAPLSGLKNLQKLWLYRNDISDITPLANLTKLTDLDLSDNQIENLTSLSGLKNLTSLDLSANQFSDISPLSGLTKLTDLELYNNTLSGLTPLSNLTNLSTLDLEYNHISDSPGLSALSGLVNLDRLYLGHNQISDLSALSGLTNLSELGLNQNQISDLTALYGLINLDELYLDGNKICDKSQIDNLQSHLRYFGITWSLDTQICS